MINLSSFSSFSEESITNKLSLIVTSFSIFSNWSSNYEGGYCESQIYLILRDFIGLNMSESLLSEILNSINLELFLSTHRKYHFKLVSHTWQYMHIYYFILILRGFSKHGIKSLHDEILHASFWDVVKIEIFGGI